MSFAPDTAVTRVGPGAFTAELYERWSSLVGIHGGYTAAIVANAMTAAIDDPWAPNGRVLAVARQTRLAGA